MIEKTGNEWRDRDTFVQQPGSLYDPLATLTPLRPPCDPLLRLLATFHYFYEPFQPLSDPLPTPYCDPIATPYAARSAYTLVAPLSPLSSYTPVARSRSLSLPLSLYFPLSLSLSPPLSLSRQQVAPPRYLPGLFSQEIHKVFLQKSIPAHQIIHYISNDKL